ncbi:hypothetical protein F5Y10DRAFT_292798 [Nemania abortiva]|nr:hypothetical protein F5Y10DRAFT_292798 [Nemania abortiva]
MNRLCRSSYGSLEAVINLDSYDGEPGRKLWHFNQRGPKDRWCAYEVISEVPLSGGSIIQNQPWRAHQAHGDLEVIVLEEDGRLQHYTSRNTMHGSAWSNSESSIEHYTGPWKHSATITRTEGWIPIFFDAAPLILCREPMGDTTYRAALETVALDENRNLTHYRCPQYRQMGGESPRPDVWHKGAVIVKSADVVGAAYLYLARDNLLAAIVSTTRGVEEYYFQSNEWHFVTIVNERGGPSCVYTTLLPEYKMKFNMVIQGGEAGGEATCLEKAWESRGNWVPNASKMPFALSSHPFIHSESEGEMNLISVVPKSDVVGARAITFQPCGTSPYGPWMILQWHHLEEFKEWVVCGVVVPHIAGMPM